MHFLILNINFLSGSLFSAFKIRLNSSIPTIKGFDGKILEFSIHSIISEIDNCDKSLSFQFDFISFKNFSNVEYFLLLYKNPK